MTTERTAAALAAVAEERRRQVERWGDGGHPDVGAVYWHNHPVLDATETLRGIVELGKDEPGGAGWLEILLEEVGEARTAAEVGASVDVADRAAWRARLRGELVQVAAVAVAWVEHIDASARASGDATEGDGDER